jgi:O-methyltransferase
MRLSTILMTNLKLLLAPLIYRNYPINLESPRLYFWLDTLYKTRHLSGAVLEIGVHHGGTSAISFNFLRQIASRREYIGIDTFSGFRKEQFAADAELGNDWRNFQFFTTNSPKLARKVLSLHDAQGVKLLQGDVSDMDRASIPDRISACLVDVDLAVPVYDGLRLVWPHMENGGVIVVDDCLENNEGDWQAIIGYRRFCKEAGLDEHFFCGVGFLVKGDPTADEFPREERRVGARAI